MSKTKFFTFGVNNTLARHYVEVKGETRTDCIKQMKDAFNYHWGLEYDTLAEVKGLRDKLTRIYLPKVHSADTSGATFSASVPRAWKESEILEWANRVFKHKDAWDSVIECKDKGMLKDIGHLTGMRLVIIYVEKPSED